MVWYIDVNKSVNHCPFVNNTVSPSSSPSQKSVTNIEESLDVSYSNTILNDLLQSTVISPPMVNDGITVSNNNIMKELFETVLTRIDHLELINASLSNEVANANKKICSLENKLKNAEDNVKMIDTRLIRNEQYVNRESLIISGIPDNIPHKLLETKVLHILHQIGLHEVTHYDITACHRLKKRNNSIYPSRTIVRFTSRRIPEFCIQNRKKLIQLKAKIKMNLRFFECLCPSNENILSHCYDLKKYGLIHEYYIRNGFIKIVKTEEDQPTKIHHISQLKELFKDFYMAEDLYQQ